LNGGTMVSVSDNGQLAAGAIEREGVESDIRAWKTESSHG
jgi:hypothetical protein